MMTEEKPQVKGLLDKPLVSIIVPFFNRDYFLDRCIKSIIGQTYKNIEIILVNDGSTDNSLRICKKYSKKDSRIIILNQSPNQGVSKARNLGLKRVQGEYVTFVDSDDWLLKKSVEEMVTVAMLNQSDYVVGSMKIIEPGRNSIDKLLNINNATKDDFEEFFSKKGYYIHAARKLLKTKIIKENDLSFPEDMPCSEDSYFMLSFLMCCKTVSSTENVVYVNNRLFENTGGTKHYRKKHFWASRVLIKMDECFRKIGFSNYKIILEQEAVKLFVKTSEEHIAFYLESDELLNVLKESYNLFNPFIGDVILNNDKVSLRCNQIIEAIRSSNISCLKVDNGSKKSLVRKIKNILKSILKRIKIVLLYGLNK